MKILIDIYHIPQFNFFKNTILNLSTGDLDITCVKRGRLEEIIRHECKGYNLIVLGNYNKYKSKAAIIFRLIIPRLLKLYQLMKNNKYSFILTASSYQSNIIAKILKIPNITFNDDPRKYLFKLLKYSADEVLVIPILNPKGKVKVFNALKEWAYLSPKYFIPQKKILDTYDLKQKNYIFVREVITSSLNYINQKSNLVSLIANKFPFDYKVILSLEDKSTIHLYPKSWILISEPTKHIHSLMYYSKIVISSGDSMAREGAMLGVPSIYCGIRKMAANKIMIDKGMLFHANINEIPQYINKITNEDIKLNEQKKFREKLEDEWDDVTELIKKKIPRNSKRYNGIN